MIDNHADYVDLIQVKEHPGYKRLEAEWLAQTAEVQKARSKAARKPSESSWRFYAGYEEGFMVAVTTLERALARMEQEGGAKPEDIAEKLLEEIRPK